MTRWGKFRPFIMFGAVPLLLINVLTFYRARLVPAPEPGRRAAHVGAGRVWAYATLRVLGLAYSMVNIPLRLDGLGDDQSVTGGPVAAAARFGSAVGGVFLTFVIAPPISALQKKSQGAYKLFTEAKKNNDTAKMAELQGQIQDIQHQLQNIFTQTTLLFVVLGTIAFMLVAYWCREAVVRTSPKTSIKETLDTLKANGPLGILCASSFFYLIGLFAVGPISSYYARYILGDMNWTLPMALVNVGISLAITPIIPAMITKLGKKNIYQYCGLLTMVGGLGLFFLPSNNAAGGAISTIAIAALVLLAIKASARLAHQHGDVRPRGRHRGIRRVEDRTSVRGCDLLDLLVHPQDHAVDRRFISGWLLTAGAYVPTPRAVAHGDHRHEGRHRPHPGHRGRAGHARVHGLPAQRRQVPPGARRDRGRKAAALAAGKPVD
jgi:Na+/melibiose symporter-like transporter